MTLKPLKKGMTPPSENNSSKKIESLPINDNIQVIDAKTLLVDKDGTFILKNIDGGKILISSGTINAILKFTKSGAEIGREYPI